MTAHPVTPNTDQTRAPGAPLLKLCRAYLAIVDSGDETRQGSERTAAHDAMMDAMQRAGIPFNARWEARWIARYLLAVDAGQLREGSAAAAGANGTHTKIMWAKIPPGADPLQYDIFENGAILLSAAPFRTEADERAHALEWYPVLVTVAPLAMYAGVTFGRNTDA